MSNIPTNKQLREWYEETLLSSSFIETLNTYQKDKLLQFTIKKIKGLLSKAVYWLECSSESNYPENLPMENWLNHIVFRNMGAYFNEATAVLNLFGWNWTLEKSFYMTEVPQPEKRVILNPEIGINDNWKNFVLEGNRLSIRQIALLCVYEGIFPSLDKEEIATKIVNFHGFNSPTSGQQLNQHYNKVLKSNDRIFVSGQKEMKNDIQKILPLISDLKKNLASKDISELKKIMNKE